MRYNQTETVFTDAAVKEFLFVKDKDKWYIDLPEYDGSREDLRMVAGADTWLDMLSGNGDCARLRISTSDPLANRLDRIFEVPLVGGAYYKARSYNGVRSNHMMWLCPVTLYVFGEYPSVIYYEVC